jgi:hypothetical protein
MSASEEDRMSKEEIVGQMKEVLFKLHVIPQRLIEVVL